MSASSPPPALNRIVGRAFVNPLVDYAFIGGGLALIVTLVVLYTGDQQLVPDASVPFFILLVNSAHFAASTVRLYTKPGTRESLPFLTLAFPLVALLLLTACIAWPQPLAQHLNALYLTWSPYHYAAQAYGLAVMYSYRSGCMLRPGDKKTLWWVAMVPFFLSFIKGTRAGLGWLAPEAWMELAVTAQFIAAARVALPVVAFAALGVLYVLVWKRSGPMPLISVLAIATNALWFVALPNNGFLWATIFHGVQYLAIVSVFHVKDHEPRTRSGVLYRVLGFYGACLLVGYTLFNALPLAYRFAGFGMVEASVAVVAAINVHHFIVDAYIWRLKKGDGNRRIVNVAALQAAPAPA